jgi:hypothetical protein
MILGFYHSKGVHSWQRKKGMTSGAVGKNRLPVQAKESD